MTNIKSKTFTQRYVDNFTPTWWENIVMRWETPRQTVMLNYLPSKSSTLVELACGDGSLLLKVAPKFKKLYGFDISPTRLRNARKKLARYRQTTILKKIDLDSGIPLPKASADVVYCEASLNCFIRPDYVLSEVHRILKKQGRFIVQVPNYAFISRRIALLLGRLPKNSAFPGFGDGGMLHRFTYASLKELLASQGLTVIAQNNSGLLAPLRKIWPSLLAGDIIVVAIKS